MELVLVVHINIGHEKTGAEWIDTFTAAPGEDCRDKVNAMLAKNLLYTANMEYLGDDLPDADIKLVADAYVAPTEEEIMHGLCGEMEEIAVTTDHPLGTLGHAVFAEVEVKERRTG